MAYGIQSPNQQSNQFVSRSINKTQQDVFYFTDFHSYPTPSNSTSAIYSDGGVGFAIASGVGNGTGTMNPAGVTAFGQTACSGFIRLNTSTSSNNSASASVGFKNGGNYYLVPGLTAPATGLICKYEFETLILTGSTIFSSASSLGGLYRFGFTDNTSGSVANGVYFEFINDGTTNDTTFWIVWKATSSQERANTSVTVSANTKYRLYLSIETNSAGTHTTTYKIKNLTTGTNTEGTATPANLARIPTSGSVTMGAGCALSRAVNTTTTPITMDVDYVGVRIRKPLNREILLKV